MGHQFAFKYADFRDATLRHDNARSEGNGWVPLPNAPMVHWRIGAAPRGRDALITRRSYSLDIFSPEGGLKTTAYREMWCVTLGMATEGIGWILIRIHSQCRIRTLWRPKNRGVVA